ncbi:MAG: acetolactate synthase large subunit, partial [Fibrobacter sp.]|nr:acetolactate synthase large subunit [Fibrobacter sp.]
MKVAQYIVEYLRSNGIKTIFGYIGGYNADILDCFCEDGDNRFVLNYHEQASAFAVNTYAELTGNVGVAIASGAPCFCNMVAGIANAYFD